jgi:hypothetical protein
MAPPKPKKAVQSAKKISSVKKAVPAVKKPAAKKAVSAKKTTSPPTKGKKPASAGKDMTKLGPIPNAGSKAIPFQGPGPTGQGIY